MTLRLYSSFILIHLALLGSCDDQADATGPSGSISTGRDHAERLTNSWECLPIPRAWSGYTHAIAIGEVAYFLHGRDVEVRLRDGAWERWPNALPHPVGPFSAASANSLGRIVVAPGGDKPGFTLDPATKEIVTIPALRLNLRRGAQLAVDHLDRPYVAIGGRQPRWGRVTDGKWEELPKIVTVNPIGAYSAGLFFVEDRMVGFGDHHMSEFVLTKHEWTSKHKLWCQIGTRSAHDRGGMVCQDPETKSLFVALGKRSRTLGIVTPRELGPFRARRFYYLKPRLPLLLEDGDRTMYVTGVSGNKRLNILSRSNNALYRIKAVDLRGVGTHGDDGKADVGTEWELWNADHMGSRGDLARERDSVCNAVFVKPYLYTQRKNILRQVHFKTFRHSANMGGATYGDRFATIGAALCYDGKRRIYLCNGYETKFWAAELYVKVGPNGGPQPELVPISFMKAIELARLPINKYAAGTRYINHDNGGGNTSMVFHDGDVYALFDPTTRVIHRFIVAKNLWQPETVLPVSIPYRAEHGVDMFSYAGKLWLLSKDTLATYDRDKGWSETESLDFSYSSNGGMATLDPDTGMVYVAIGGGTRDLATIHLESREQKVLKDHFPDTVSVHGRRVYIGELDGSKYLGLFRGHDTAEQWRLKLPADGRL